MLSKDSVSSNYFSCASTPYDTHKNLYHLLSYNSTILVWKQKMSYIEEVNGEYKTQKGTLESILSSP